MTTLHRTPRTIGLTLLAILSLAPAASAQIAVSANDNKVSNVNGVVKVVPNPPSDTVAVIDLKANPPKVLATLEAGKGAAGISINRQGTLALVSNLADGTVSVFRIQGKTVAPAGTVEVGGEKAGGGTVAITPDGKTALVSRNVDNKVSVLSIDGDKVAYTKRDMTPGVRPIVLDIASKARPRKG